MEKDISKCIEIYQKQLVQGDIQLAYSALVKYVAELKAKFPQLYSMGNISFGYLDYTYFPFFNEYLRSHKLRFGIVLNHKEMQFELWIMGQNASIQKEYWEIFRNTEWNKDIKIMPKAILSKSISLAMEIQKFIENIDQ